MGKKNKEIIKFNSYEDLKQLYAQKVNEFEERRKNLIENSNRSDLQIVIENFIIRIIKEIRRLNIYLDKDIEILAWTTRNLYELKVILKYILESEERFNIWMSELASDEKQVLEGLISLSEDDSTSKNVKILKDRIEELENIAKKHNLFLGKPKPIKQLAMERAEDLSDHNALYKFLSKYVHPSSWLLNATEERINAIEYRNIFIIKSQFFIAEIQQIIDTILKNKNST